MSEKTLNVKVEAKRLLEEWRSDDGRGIEFELDVICSEKDLDTFPEAGQKFTIHVHLTRGMEDSSFTPEGIGVGDEYQAVIDEEPI